MYINAYSQAEGQSVTHKGHHDVCKEVSQNAKKKNDILANFSKTFQ